MLRLIAGLLVTSACGRIAFEDISALDPTGDGGRNGDGQTGDGNNGLPPSSVYLVHSLAAVTSQIYTLDVLTGQMTLVANVSPSFGEVTGLAVRDANHLYATTYTGNLFEITLQPYTERMLQAGLGPLVALARMDNGDLIALDDAADDILTFTAEPFQLHTRQQLMDEDFGTPTFVEGGDLMHDPLLGEPRWLGWQNFPARLLLITNNGAALMPMSPLNAYVTGTALVDGVLYAVTSDLDQVHVIDRPTGALMPGIPLCVACPTPFDLEYGDLAN